MLIADQTTILSSDDQTIDLVGQQLLEIVFFFGRIVLTVADQNLIAIAIKLTFHLGFQLTEKRIVNGRKDHADQIRPLLIQLASDDVGAIIKFLHCFLDLGNCFFA